MSFFTSLKHTILCISSYFCRRRSFCRLKFLKISKLNTTFYFIHPTENFCQTKFISLITKVFFFVFFFYLQKFDFNSIRFLFFS